MCQICIDFAEFDAIVDKVIAAELPALMAEPITPAVAPPSLSGPHSPSAGHPCRGIGVGISTDPQPAPRHGGLAFFRTESGRDFG